jgi:hypothetical protein
VLFVVRIFANAANLANIKIANNPQVFFTVKTESKDSQPNYLSMTIMIAKDSKQPPSFNETLGWLHKLSDT